MGYFAFVSILVVIGVALYFLGRSMSHAIDAEIASTGKFTRRIGPGVCVVLALALSVLYSYVEVPAGNIGIVYAFGAITDQVGEGMSFVAPWKIVKVANVQVQRHVFGSLQSFSKESQTVEVTASLNTRVSPQAIQELYRSVGENFFEVLVVPRVSQNFKDEIVKYASVEVAPNRENIRHAVSQRLQKELESRSIEVVDLLLDNVDFSDAFEQSIEAKQVATQKALEEEQKIKVEENKALQAVQRAKGEGDSLLAKAKGEGAAILAVAEKQAEANKKLSESLTPVLVQYTMVQKLSDRISVMLLPAGQSFILDPKGLIDSKSEK